MRPDGFAACGNPFCEGYQPLHAHGVSAERSVRAGEERGRRRRDVLRLGAAARILRPGSLKFAGYLNAYIEDATDASLTDRPEDTTIPMFFIGDDFTPGRDVRTL